MVIYKEVIRDREKRLAYFRAYNAVNRERRNLQSREYNKRNAEKRRANSILKYAEKREEILKQKQEYYQRVKSSIHKKQRERYAIDPVYRLRKVVSRAVRKAMLGNKNTSVLQKLGYSIEQLRKHLESQWESWMTWNNYGPAKKDIRTWQIDHVIPQSALPYLSMDDPNFKTCWSLSNLRPMESLANIAKGNRRENGFSYVL